jgi:hypothetical protein
LNEEPADGDSSCDADGEFEEEVFDHALFYLSSLSSLLHNVLISPLVALFITTQEADILTGL